MATCALLPPGFVAYLSPMPWVWLIIAGILEVAWAVGLKYTDGFSRLWPTVATVVLMLGSFWCLAQAVRVLPLGTSYAIWTGIGAVGTAIAGIVLFKEPATAARLACIVLIVAGIAGLKLTLKG
jgi:quaternary ammonium compound-resistance protein SugE